MAKTDEQATVEAPRSFGVFLSQVADGDAERELGAELQKLMKKLREEAVPAGGAAKGALTVKFTFEVLVNGEVGIRYAIGVKEPEATRTKSTMWLNTGGNVVFEPPRQQKLFPRDVSVSVETREVGAAREVREV